MQQIGPPGNPAQSAQHNQQAATGPQQQPEQLINALALFQAVQQLQLEVNQGRQRADRLLARDVQLGELIKQFPQHLQPALPDNVLDIWSGACDLQTQLEVLSAEVSRMLPPSLTQQRLGARSSAQLTSSTTAGAVFTTTTGNKAWGSEIAAAAVGQMPPPATVKGISRKQAVMHAQASTHQQLRQAAVMTAPAPAAATTIRTTNSNMYLLNMASGTDVPSPVVSLAAAAAVAGGPSPAAHTSAKRQREEAHGNCSVIPGLSPAAVAAGVPAWSLTQAPSPRNTQAQLHFPAVAIAPPLTQKQRQAQAAAFKAAAHAAEFGFWLIPAPQIRPAAAAKALTKIRQRQLQAFKAAAHAAEFGFWLIPAPQIRPAAAAAAGVPMQSVDSATHGLHADTVPVGNLEAGTTNTVVLDYEQPEEAAAPAAKRARTTSLAAGNGAGLENGHGVTTGAAAAHCNSRHGAWMSGRAAATVACKQAAGRSPGCTAAAAAGAPAAEHA